jgi:hypothetical protein
MSGLEEWVVMMESPSSLEETTPVDGNQPATPVFEDTEEGRKALKKAKRDAKRAKRAAAKAAEKAADEARREAGRKRNEALKVTVVDGNVVDKQGRIIRPYTRAEQFLDNKLLVYALLIAFIIICLLLTALFAFG